MFFKKRPYISGSQDVLSLIFSKIPGLRLNLSDIIASVVHESKKEYMGIEEKPVVTIHRPDMNIVTGSKSGGSIAHLHFRRSEPIKEGLVYNMNNNGVAGASYSYDVY